MSNSSRNNRAKQSLEDPNSAFAKAERELAEGYLEVELTGLTMRRLVAAYTVLLRNAWHYTMHSLRSLLRPTPVH